MSQNFESTTLWQHGKDGYSLYHVFSLVATKNAVLAFAEARQGGKDADETHDIVMRRSTDGGQTFEKSVCLFGGGRCLVNPTPIWDAITERVLLFFAENLENKRTVLYLSHSDDEVVSWSEPRDLTHAITKKNDTTFHLPGPSHGIQLQKSPQTGRLLLQLWHRGTDVTLPRTARGYCASLLYSDDHGEHWNHIPALGHALCANESALCETDEGVLWALRSFGTQHAMTKSADGGVTWSEVQILPLAPAFACQAGVVPYPLRKLAPTRYYFRAFLAPKRSVGAIWRSVQATMAARPFPHTFPSPWGMPRRVTATFAPWMAVTP